jgi:hypothetical protein
MAESGVEETVRPPKLRNPDHKRERMLGFISISVLHA